MYQATPESYDTGLRFQIDGQILVIGNKFKFLRSTIANNNSLDAELDIRSNFFPRLLVGWRSESGSRKKIIRKKDKCAVYLTIVHSTLLYSL